ncbi:MAG: hypothetical protein ACYC1Q_10750, partial [Bacteroidia bacterium]
MIRAKVNDKMQFDLQIKDGQVKINDKQFVLDALRMEEGAMHLIIEGRSYRVRILDADKETKAYTLSV